MIQQTIKQLPLRRPHKQQHEFDAMHFEERRLARVVHQTTTHRTDEILDVLCLPIVHLLPSLHVLRHLHHLPRLKIIFAQ